MDNKHIRSGLTACVVLLWAALSVFAWLKTPEESSDAERRTLVQRPEFSFENVLSGTFMTQFEDYTTDQFPFRQRFRQLKAEFHYNVLSQKDNNGIYLVDGVAAKLEYPLSDASLDHAVSVFDGVYTRYLEDTGCKIYQTVVPDKGYYLASKNGYPAMDYATLMDRMKQGLPWAHSIDLTDCLTADDYYRTDTHWRQERLLSAAQKLCAAMDAEKPHQGDYTPTSLNIPFYGVYYGQAAISMGAETIHLMESEILSDCTVYNYETGTTSSVYDLQKLNSRDLYDVYLSGAAALLQIDNPNAATDRELVVFRDSFGSSMVPLLVQGYKTVTLVDLRYMSSGMLDQFIEFDNQDVLFLYSTLVLNDSNALKD